MSVRTEPRTVRPYLLPPELASFLDDAVLSVGELECAAGKVTLDVSTLADEVLAISVPNAGKGLRDLVLEAGYDPEDVALMLISYSRPMRRSIVIAEHPLSGSIPRTIEIDRGADPLVFGSQRGFDLLLAVVLRTEQERRPLRAWQAGTWLTRADFAVRPEMRESALNPSLLTKEIREQFDVPDETLWWVRMHAAGEDLLQAGSVEEAVTVYLDEKVYNLLITEEDDGTGNLVQALLATDTLMELAQSIVAALEQSLGQHIGTGDLVAWPFADRTLRQIGDTVSRSSEQVLLWARSEPATLRSRIQGAFAAASTARSALKGVGR